MELDACAGFSLGEYTALTAAGVLTLEDGLRLVRRRGELMQEAADSTDGCMAAVLGLADDIVEDICSRTEGLVLPVNYNCDGQLVIAGERTAVDLAAAADSVFAAAGKRSGQFHKRLGPVLSDSSADRVPVFFHIGCAG